LLEPYIRYSPLVARPRITWPDEARVALWVVPNVELYDYVPLHNPYRAAAGRGEFPDVMDYGYRDYANRIGFWRMLEVFDQYKVRATVSLNVEILSRYPEIRDAIVDREWAVMSHGLYNSRFLFGMTLDEERAFFAANVELVRRHTGRELKGMLCPDMSMTPNTMNLMAEAGLTYSADWFVDDQPFPIHVLDGRLVGVPYSWEINDGLLMSYGLGTHETDYFVQICCDQFDTLYSEGETSGRVMCIALHPLHIGKPHRVAGLAKVFDYILSRPGVWVTTGDEIAEHYLTHHYTAALSHLEMPAKAHA
jgi:peptidoglycan/xylan/chitin deacetylase (PgdA/CDA1 family)